MPNNIPRKATIGEKENMCVTKPARASDKYPKMVIKKEAIKNHDRILNDVAKDPKLSDNARGLYLRMFMLPEGQCFDDEFVEMGKGGWRSWLSGMVQLEKNGYIRIESLQDPTTRNHFGLGYVNECHLMGRVEK